MLSATAPVGIVLVDDAGNLTYVNEQYLRITGLQLEDAHGTAWKAVIHPDDLQRVCEIREKASALKEDYALSYRYLNRGGGTVAPQKRSNPHARTTTDRPLATQISSSSRFA